MPALSGSSRVFVTTLFIFSSDLFMVKITIYSGWGAEGKWSFLYRNASQYTTSFPQSECKRPKIIEHLKMTFWFSTSLCLLSLHFVCPLHTRKMIDFKPHYLLYYSTKNQRAQQTFSTGVCNKHEINLRCYVRRCTDCSF